MEPKYLKHDVQAETSGFNKISLKKVGVRNIKHPLILTNKFDGKPIVVNGTLSGYVNLNADNKGINMSRFSRTLLEITKGEPLNMNNFKEVANELRKSHNSDNLYLKASFEYLIKDESPVTDLPATEPIPVDMEVVIKDDNIDTYMTVEGTQISCCPCSKNMSMLVNNITDEQEKELKEKLSPDLYEKVIQAGFGAHNQRSVINIKVKDLKGQKLPWIEDIYNITINAASAKSCNTLKRSDEKFETEVMYLGGWFNDDMKFEKVENSGPKFCEDIARDSAKQLFDILDKDISDFVVVVDNQESIHTSLNATAVVSAGRELI